MTTSQVVSTELKKYKSSENAFLPKIVTILLSQEKGNVCNPLVKVGDLVNEGDVIAVSETDTSVAKIHSPIPGKVVDIVMTLGPNGCYEKSIRIRFSGSFSYTGKKLLEKRWHACSEKTLIDRIIEKGICNTFVTNKPVSLGGEILKLNEKADRNLVVRLFDDDKLRIADSLLSKFFYEKIVKGAEITAKAVSAKNIIFVVDSKSDLLKEQSNEVNKDSNDTEKSINQKNISVIKTSIVKYPSGNKRQIILSVNKKKNANVKIAKDDLFVDSYAMLDVYNGIVLDMPVISRYVHFSGNCIPASCFLQVKIGYTIRDLIEQVGGFVNQPSMVLINGQICGNAINRLDIPVTKYVKSIEFISKAKKTDTHIYSCIDCGNCRSICKVGISPDLLYKYTTNKMEITEKQIESSKMCSDCGLCNTVCPSRLPLCQTIAVLNNRIAGVENEK